MSKVRVLDTHLTNMIAAGEVVERPAGIVKELVENAIDANASVIEIRIVEGGMTRIDVIDNGDGMTADDLSQAFERHSTSKISDSNDLFSLSTFGFRGEALPSIASVSLVDASTNNGVQSRKITIDNGHKGDVIAFARNQGTTITVQNVFQKTPARLKYIKNINYETSIIQDTIQKFAMGNPHIQFSYYNEDKLSFRSYGKDILDVFHRVYGSSVSEDAMTFEAENFDFKISGVMAQPRHNKANRFAIWLYVNNRMIRYPKAQKAIVDAYRRFMPSDRYPIVVMKIDVDPQLVDVNVHPSKWEIRMSKEEQLVELIISHLESKLSNTMRPQRVLSQRIVEPSIQQDLFKPVEKDVSVTYEVQEPAFTPETIHKEIIEVSDTVDTIASTTNHEEPEVESIEEAYEAPIQEPGIEPLTVLSQMSGKYILAQGDSGLYIVDQHAAMERVRYEYYQKKLLNKDHDMQDLLIPMMIEGRQPLVTRIEEINTVFAPFSIVLEEFSDDTFIVRSVPTWIKPEEVFEFINTVLDLIEKGNIVREEDMRRLTIATLACHSSVRFNEYMSMEAMVTLVEQLRMCEQPFHCPHGRPTLILMDHKSLLKEFNR